MSGAGRSAAADVLEDLGFFVIDNLPPALIPKVAELGRGRRAAARASRSSSTCAPASSSTTSERALAELRASGARTASVPRRRRRRARPPLRGDAPPPPARGHRPGVRRHHRRAGAARRAEGPGRPRHRHVEPQRARAARPTARAVRRRASRQRALQTSIVSFGYKHGIPLDVDLLFDCRFLPNPHWIDALRPLPATDEPVRELRARPARGDGVPRRARAAASRCCCPRTCARARRTCRSASAAPAAVTAAS